MPNSADLVTDLPADFEVFGQAVATSMADLLGGTTGQILSKTSNTDMDFTWIANDQGDITAVNVTSPITGGGSAGAVTVGIQSASTSQSGAVQLSDSTSTTSSVLAATPTAVKSAYDLANGAIAKTTVTTAGDIIYRNATVPVRLGIGTAGQVLQVNSGATAPEWATASSGGMTLLSTTTLSGATTTISSISGSYTNLQVQIFNAAASSAGIVTFGINGDTTHHSQAALSGAGTVYATSLGKGNLTNNANQDAASSGGTGNWTVNFYNYASGNRFHYEGGGMFYASGWTSTFLGGAFEGTAGMTSLTITTSAGTFSTGTVKIWGVK
jgi:hypothetical protein